MTPPLSIHIYPYTYGMCMMFSILCTMVDHARQTMIYILKPISNFMLHNVSKNTMAENCQICARVAASEFQKVVGSEDLIEKNIGRV